MCLECKEGRGIRQGTVIEIGIPKNMQDEVDEAYGWIAADVRILTR